MNFCLSTFSVTSKILFYFSFYFQDQSPAKIEELYSSTQQKSFESIMRAPYQQKPPIYTNDARSIESPYTSLGSCRSSYASIKPNSYSSLRARSLKANAQHESKSKGINTL